MTQTPAVAPGVFAAESRPLADRVPDADAATHTVLEPDRARAFALRMRLPRPHHSDMTSRVAKMLDLAAELQPEERAELADELWSTVPDELSPEWQHELRQRVDEMNAADTRGEPVGEALTFDEMIRRVRTG